MALWSTSLRVEQHGVGQGGGAGKGTEWGAKGTADGNGNRKGTAKVDTSGSEEYNGDRKRKGVCWWGTRSSNEKPPG